MKVTLKEALNYRPIKHGTLKFLGAFTLCLYLVVSVGLITALVFGWVFPNVSLVWQVVVFSFLPMFALSSVVYTNDKLRGLLHEYFMRNIICYSLQMSSCAPGEFEFLVFSDWELRKYRRSRDEFGYANNDRLLVRLGWGAPDLFGKWRVSYSQIFDGAKILLVNIKDNYGNCLRSIPAHKLFLVLMFQPHSPYDSINSVFQEFISLHQTVLAEKEAEAKKKAEAVKVETPTSEFQSGCGGCGPIDDCVSCQSAKSSNDQ